MKYILFGKRYLQTNLNFYLKSFSHLSLGKKFGITKECYDTICDFNKENQPFKLEIYTNAKFSEPFITFEKHLSLSYDYQELPFHMYIQNIKDLDRKSKRVLKNIIEKGAGSCSLIENPSDYDFMKRIDAPARRKLFTVANANSSFAKVKVVDWEKEKLNKLLALYTKNYGMFEKIFNELPNLGSNEE